MFRDWEKTTQSLLTGFSAGDRVDTKNELRNVILIMGTLMTILSVVILLPEYPLFGFTITEIMFAIFFFLGVGSLIIATFVAISDYRNFDKVHNRFSMEISKRLGYVLHEITSRDDNDPEKKKFEYKLGSFLGEYYSPLITQIMSIGVVPIILGIIVLILSDLTSTEPYVWDINITTALLLIGGCMEAMAFLLGFLFPEGSGNENIMTEEVSEVRTSGMADAEIIKSILKEIMPELQKGINETFRNMTVETRVSYSDSNHQNSQVLNPKK